VAKKKDTVFTQRARRAQRTKRREKGKWKKARGEFAWEMGGKS
jgi:hypothetical protein